MGSGFQIAKRRVSEASLEAKGRWLGWEDGGVDIVEEEGIAELEGDIHGDKRCIQKDLDDLQRSEGE